MKFIRISKKDKYSLPNETDIFKILNYVKNAMKKEGYPNATIQDFVREALAHGDNYFKIVVKSKINELNGKNFFGDKLIEY